MDADHPHVRSKAKKPWAVERWVSSRSSSAVPDSCQPGTAASVSFRGLPGLTCIIDRPDIKDKAMNRVYINGSIDSSSGAQLMVQNPTADDISWHFIVDTGIGKRYNASTVELSG